MRKNNILFDIFLKLFDLFEKRGPNYEHDIPYKGFELFNTKACKQPCVILKDSIRGLSSNVTKLVITHFNAFPLFTSHVT